MTPHHGEAIGRVLAVSSGPKSAEQLAEILGLEPVEVRASLHRMRLDGAVVREVSDFNRYTYRLPKRVGVPLVNVAKVVPVLTELAAPVLKPAPVPMPVPVPEAPAPQVQAPQVQAPEPAPEPETPAPRYLARSGPKPGVALKAKSENTLILEALKTHGPNPSHAIAKLTGLVSERVHSRVNYLKARNRLQVVGHMRPNVYRLPPEPVEVTTAIQTPTALSTSLEAASHALADALNVPESVLQCTYIAIQVEAVIAKLHRPANSVLADLVAATQNLRSASALLAKEANKTGASP